MQPPPLRHETCETPNTNRGQGGRRYRSTSMQAAKMIILTTSEQAQLTKTKKKAEVNCSFEDVEVSIRSNEDIRKRNCFSSVWSYCMEHTDGQLLCPTNMLLRNRCPSATQHTLGLGSRRPSLLDGLHAIILQMGQHSPQTYFITVKPEKCSSAQALSTWVLTSSHLKGSELPCSAGSEG